MLNNDSIGHSNLLENSAENFDQHIEKWLFNFLEKYEQNKIFPSKKNN